MASLNTLRTKGGWIISIVIGIALLAFILPEVFRGSGGTNPNKIKVGEIYGEKVSYTEYSNRYDYYNDLMGVLNGRTNFSNEEMAQIQDMAWQDLINEYVYTPGFEKLGLIPYDDEKTDMVAGQYISPIIMREFSDPQTGMFDRAALANFVGSLDNPNALMAWENLKKQMVEQRAQQKYMVLVAKGMNVTDMEVDAQYDADNKIYSAKVVAQMYSEIPDSLVTVSNADINKYYNSHKELFREKASRDIEYVVFNVLPSEDDYADAKGVVEQMAADFAANTTPMQFATLNTQGRMDNSFKKESEIPAEIAAAIWDQPEAMYGPVLSSDVYTMARLGEVKMSPDSLGARHILLPPAAANVADSLVTLLRGGADFTEVAQKYSVDPSVKQNNGNLGIFTPEAIDMMIPGFSEELLAHNTGEVFLINAQWGTHIVEKTYQSAPVKKAQVAMIEYNVDPSSATEMDVLNQVRQFQQTATGSYDNFRKAVSENGLSKRVARVNSTDRNVSGLLDSKELVRWAFSNDKGTVSGDIRIGADTYVIAVLTGVTEDGIGSMENYRDEIRMAVAQQKKGELLASKIKGGTIEEVAAAVGKEVVDVQDVQFSAFSIQGVGSDGKLIGAITSGVPEGKLSKPVIGDNGVYMFVITGTTPKEITKETERVVLESANQVYLDQRLMFALDGITDVKDGRVRYF